MPKENATHRGKICKDFNGHVTETCSNVQQCDAQQMMTRCERVDHQS
jgi:hypothetical protein